MDNNQSLKAQQQMQQARFQLHEPAEYDDVDDEEVEIAPLKKLRQKGPMDMYYTPNPYETVKGRNRKGGKQQTINEVCRKDLRDKVCHDIGRWFYDAQIVVEAIRQFGPRMKPPSMYELRVPILKKEVENVKAEKGCSILSDGWRDSVVQKDVINFPNGVCAVQYLQMKLQNKIGFINMLDWCLSYHQMIQNPNSVLREELDLQNPDSVMRGELELELELELGFLQCIDVDQDLEPMENNIVGLDMEDGCPHPGGSTDPLFYQQPNSGIPDSNALNPESYHSLLVGTESDDFNALSAGT
ncbi:hypothetical protein LXL04_023520 [Taraxacum kok-saghyz]